jgi:hypothetical protein
MRAGRGMSIRICREGSTSYENREADGLRRNCRLVRHNRSRGSRQRQGPDASAIGIVFILVITSGRHRRAISRPRPRRRLARWTGFSRWPRMAWRLVWPAGMGRSWVARWRAWLWLGMAPALLGMGRVALLLPRPLWRLRCSRMPSGRMRTAAARA